MGHFTVKSVTDMKTAKKGDTIGESDYSLYTSDDNFVQFEYVEDEEVVSTYSVKPGIYAIEKDMTGYHLRAASFSKERILEDYVSTKEISAKINAFFDSLHIYQELEIPYPKRGILLYGDPGTGKTQVISKVCMEYAKRTDTAIVIWHTDKFEAHEVKAFVKRFEYKGVDKFILIAEDIGGMEYEGPKMGSSSSLLSLLDNVERTFTLPTMILATTNFPQNMLGNLTNRPQRFDDKIAVAPPGPEFRAKFISFFSKDKAPEEVVQRIKDKKFDKFSVAHVKEVVIRSMLYQLPMKDALEQVREELELALVEFQKRARLGLGLSD